MPNTILFVAIFQIRAIIVSYEISALAISVLLNQLQVLITDQSGSDSHKEFCQQVKREGLQGGGCCSGKGLYEEKLVTMFHMRQDGLQKGVSVRRTEQGFYCMGNR